MTVSDQVIAVLETICDKIGIVIDNVADLLPAFTKYGLATHGFSVGVYGVVLACTLVYLIRLIQIDYRDFKLWEAHEQDRRSLPPEDVSLLNIIGLLVAIITCFVIGNFGTELKEFIGWVAAPEVKMIYEILKMLPQ